MNLRGPKIPGWTGSQKEKIEGIVSYATHSNTAGVPVLGIALEYSRSLKYPFQDKYKRIISS